MAAGERRDDPEDGLTVLAPLQEFPAAVDRDGPRLRGEVAAEEERCAGHRDRRVEGPGQLADMAADHTGGHIGAAQEFQQLPVELGLPVRVEDVARGQVAQPDGRVAQRGDERHMRGDPGGEHPRRHLFVEGGAGVERGQPALDAVPGVQAPAAHRVPPGEPGRDGRVQGAQRAGRVVDDSVRAEAARQVVRGEHRLRIAQFGPRHETDLQQGALVTEFAGLEGRIVLLRDDHDVHVGGGRQLGVIRPADGGPAEVAPR